jgi:hypothetical protein
LTRSSFSLAHLAQPLTNASTFPQILIHVLYGCHQLIILRTIQIWRTTARWSEAFFTWWVWLVPTSPLRSSQYLVTVIVPASLTERPPRRFWPI